MSTEAPPKFSSGIRLHITEPTKLPECQNHTVVKYIEENHTVVNHTDQIQKPWMIIIIVSGLMHGVLVFVVIGVINKVSLQNTVVGFIGSSVVLPCSSAKHDFKLEDINVHWRQNGRIHVYDIIKGKDSVADQDPQYKNRIKTFPEEYERRNFSIKLNNLTHADAGEFSCFITHSSHFKQETETVRLFINGV
ncbi:CD276 antigen-like protein [Labeo rohita]|uniref:CD276 antigen-like protein n=1 Tax=Labeo rohita TaxID=84645 RepID=A0A498M1U3_LABRO|nr:CD276 antigen-like protein [Labeo rohita]